MEDVLYSGLGLLPLAAQEAKFVERLNHAERLNQADRAKAVFAHPDGDHATLLNAYHAYLNAEKSEKWCYQSFLNSKALRSADNVRAQLLNMMQNQFQCW